MGKTTCAAAMAVHAARSGLRTLVISSDPAPSLGDAFDLPLGAAPRRIPAGRASLHAIEIDAPRALERWLSVRRPALERIAARGTMLDDEDIARILRLSLPGIDEVAALLEVLRHGRSGRFDLVVIDTAPTGHTLRMFSMPEMLRRLAAVFDAMQAKHRALAGALRGRWIPDEDDALLEELDREGRELAMLLSDPERMAAWWVTLPEPMAVEETADGLAALAAAGIHVEQVIVNRLTDAPAGRCRRCEARLSFERRAVTSLRRVATRIPLTGVLSLEREPRGVRALGAVGAAIARRDGLPARRAGAQMRWRAEVGGSSPGDLASLLAGGGTRLLMFGGKGGVGKTTCAAAAALAIARGREDRRVLLLSTDPAHSLADLLGTAIGDGARWIEGSPAGLTVRELDAGRRFREIRTRYAAAVDALFDRISRGSAIDASHDRQVMTDLIDLAPPGIDELVAVAEVTDALGAAAGPDRFDLVVMDMAPSGHALRLLETPAIVQEWARALMAILLKYQHVVRLGELGAMVLRLSQELGRLRELLRDPVRTRFVAVTRGAALPAAETARLVARLSRMRIAVPVAIVNAAGRGTCARCRREAAAESREVARMRRGAGSRARTILTAPGEVPPPDGVARLESWASRWRTGGPGRGA